ncbi:MAG: hypothetical protein JXA35_02765 [Deltaproteobacteria bacterium]|nr:hypothetical protein [Deltaproteobacteria bacterium]
MKTILIKLVVLAVMLTGLPLSGIILAGLPSKRYFEFPPKTIYITHAPFSFPVFITCLILLVALVLFFAGRAVTCRRSLSLKPGNFKFPWWGWTGTAAGIFAWIIAWTRFPFFEGIQPYTFIPLWLSFIIAANALAYRRNGYCLMLDRPGIFLLLFPVSSLFWWFFEYLNRFVQNWFYTGVSLNPGEYFWHATLSFSTVLPAVHGVYEWIRGMPWIEDCFGNFIRLRPSRPRVTAWILIIFSGAGLFCLGVWPDYLFALLWISPLLIIISLKTLFREDHILTGVTRGYWSVVVSASLAALVCGWFWEMWNFFSLAKWKYSIPFVQAYQIFEMPVLGYAGYISFGLECAAVWEAVGRLGAKIPND